MVAAHAGRLRARSLLPVGIPLSDTEWARRHRLILITIALQVPVLAVLAAFVWHRHSMVALYEFVGLIILPGMAAAVCEHRRAASILAALALLGTSATMVELMNGSTSAHFDFFISLGLIALYQSWPVYLLAVTFTAVHHIGMALWMPMNLFSMGSAESTHPVTWSIVHAVFVLGSCAASVAFWRFAEESQIASTAAQARAAESLAEQLAAAESTAAERAASASETAAALDAQQADRAHVDRQIAVLTDATTTVSAGVSQAADAVTSIDDAIQAIADNVGSAASITREAVALVGDTSTAISELAGELTKVSQLAKAISGIAAQTNLLALNATIEAARAGDAGKGFAVVASEVKELASGTARATVSIEEIAQRTGAGADAALLAMNQVSGVIDNINGYTTTIADAVEKQSVTTAQTRASFGEVATGAAEIAGAVQNLAGRPVSTVT